VLLDVNFMRVDAAIFTAAPVCGLRPVRAAEFVNVLTGGTSGVYYPMGVALSQIYGKALPGDKVSVQATKALA
jgi:TRAP-type uncharacterized transport system substrate-binding protein